jgi:hypothetical protein
MQTLAKDDKIPPVVHIFSAIFSLHATTIHGKTSPTLRLSDKRHAFL